MNHQPCSFHPYISVLSYYISVGSKVISSNIMPPRMELAKIIHILVVAVSHARFMRK